MEDFFETKISEVDGQMVGFFGVFDGMLIVHDLKHLSFVPFLFVLINGQCAGL